ncbi:MAG: DNA mismatch repair endonuclease MutL [Flavobacteriales bacterium]|nr:DNA mismatch repair endonuclease MutL [Flavobacteriales bacterium]
MSIIQLLPDHIANQIAAGEVIQRPASVIKEMVENAIDAGATSIKVIIKDAGRTLIQIIDDGDGMNEKDAVLCFERHATSKLKTADDLFQLQTKGFRGEALASIAAIAHVTLKTKHKDEAELGIKIEVEGSTIKINERVVCPKGSSFEVKNLFYNVPARRNFLKSDAVEFSHIREEMERIIFAHPNVHFSLYHNGQTIYELQSAILRKRIVDVFGKSIQEKLVPIAEETNIVKIHGYIGKPDAARKSRGEQYLFVNNRFFKDSYFHHAITKAYEGLIAEKTYPTYFIFFEIDPSKIDVNIHPTKTEIKFEEDRFIYSILLSSVKQALGKYNVYPTLDFEQETSFDVPSSVRKSEPVAPYIEVNPNFNPFQSTSPSSNAKGGSSGFSTAMKNVGFGSDAPTTMDWENFYKIKEEEAPIEAQKIDFEETIEETVVEQTDNLLIRSKYIITNCKSGLLLIDYKRANERIVYDELQANFIHSPIAAQQLLFPFEKNISKQEAIQWSTNTSLFNQLGFIGEIQDENLLINAIPSFLSDEHINDVLDNMMETLMHREIEKSDLAHKLISDIAKSASRTLSISTIDQGKKIIDQLFQCENHSFSPTGKKIISTLTFEEIAQKF